MGVVSQGCSMALEVWGHVWVWRAWALLGNPEIIMILDGPVSVGEWYGSE